MPRTPTPGFWRPYQAIIRHLAFGNKPWPFDFGLGFFDQKWTLPSLIPKNPVAWMIEVNGFIVDARHMPRAIQEEAFRCGLIPYVPERSAED